MITKYDTDVRPDITAHVGRHDEVGTAGHAPAYIYCEETLKSLFTTRRNFDFLCGISHPTCINNG